MRTTLILREGSIALVQYWHTLCLQCIYAGTPIRTRFWTRTETEWSPTSVLASPFLYLNLVGVVSAKLTIGREDRSPAREHTFARVDINACIIFYAQAAHIRLRSRGGEYVCRCKSERGMVCARMKYTRVRTYVRTNLVGRGFDPHMIYFLTVLL